MKKFISLKNLEIFRKMVISVAELLQLEVNLKRFAETVYDSVDGLQLCATMHDSKSDRSVYLTWGTGDKTVVMRMRVGTVSKWEERRVSELTEKSGDFLKDYLQFAKSCIEL